MTWNPVILISLILLLTGSSCSFSLPFFHFGEKASQGEEYALLSDLLNSTYIGSETRMVVIEQNASTGLGSDDLGSSLEYVRDKIPELSDSISADFVARNTDPYVFEQSFAVDVEVVLITEAEMNAIFQDSNGWDAFYERYPNSPGILSLSRPGFNPAGDEAVVYAGQQVHWLAGAGYFYYLVKEGDHWVVKNQVMTWIS